jgi:hypothetical protein
MSERVSGWAGAYDVRTSSCGWHGRWGRGRHGQLGRGDSNESVAFYKTEPLQVRHVIEAPCPLLRRRARYLPATAPQ